jgi:DNA polymerase
MPKPIVDERLRLIREYRQRLEDLARAGVDRIPAPPLSSVPLRRPSPPSGPVAESPTARRERAAAPTAPVAAPPPRAVAAPLPQPQMASLFGDELSESPAIPPAERAGHLAVLAAEVAVCERCPPLAATRTQTVFGTGSPTARLMFVGEAPGFEEDRTGLPFVGRAGQLLTDMITKGMGLSREEVYIANVLKSRPPDNRSPLPDEIAHCLPYLERQIEIIRPEFLCMLGAVATTALLKTALSMSRLRGRWHRYRGIPTIVTYHPAYLLRNPAAKKESWEDLQMLMKAMGLKPPLRRRDD